MKGCFLGPFLLLLLLNIAELRNWPQLIPAYDELDRESLEPTPPPCPSRIYNQEGFRFRNTGEGETPCRGDISRCIYSSDWLEFCMNGYAPHYTEQRLPYRQYKKEEQKSGVGNYVTTSIGESGLSAVLFNISTTKQPATQYTFVPGIHQVKLSNR